MACSIIVELKFFIVAVLLNQILSSSWLCYSFLKGFPSIFSNYFCIYMSLFFKLFMHSNFLVILLFLIYYMLILIIDSEIQIKI